MAEGLNQMIALHGRGLNLDPAGQLGRGQQVMAGFQDLQMQPLRKKEAELRLAALEQENEANTDEFKIRDLATDAIKIKPLLESGDLTRANTMIAERIQKIMQRGGDPSDTMAFRDALNSGQITPQQAAAELDAEILAAEKGGYLQSTVSERAQGYKPDSRTQFLVGMGYQPGTPEYQSAADKYFGPRAGAGTQPPAAIQEWEAYQRMSPEERKAFNEMKRGAGYSSTTEKQIFNASDAYIDDNAAAVNYEDLAQRYKAAEGKISSGAVAGVKEWMKEYTGNEDELTALRKDWTQIKASEVVKNLPPGAASDADIKMALEGFISNNAEPAEVAAKLRGMAKLRRLNAEYNAFKADYLSENRNPGGLRKAWADRVQQAGMNQPTTASAQPRGQQPAQQGQYTQGQIIEAGGKRYRVIGGDPNDPDIEEIP